MNWIRSTDGKGLPQHVAEATGGHWRVATIAMGEALGASLSFLPLGERQRRSVGVFAEAEDAMFFAERWAGSETRPGEDLATVAAGFSRRLDSEGLQRRIGESLFRMTRDAEGTWTLQGGLQGRSVVIARVRRPSEGDRPARRDVVSPSAMDILCLGRMLDAHDVRRRRAAVSAEEAETAVDAEPAEEELADA